MKKSFYIIIGIILLMTSCGGEKRLYSWYNYEDTSYQYIKNPNQNTLEALTKTYESICNKQKATRQIVPPGIYAEQAYILLQAGKKDAAISLFNKEKECYPESKQFIESITNRLQK